MSILVVYLSDCPIFMSEIVFNSPQPDSSNPTSQVANFQTTLASLNQQVIILQETVQEKDREIVGLKSTLALSNQVTPPPVSNHTDSTLTLAGILINLYKFIFLPGKAA